MTTKEKVKALLLDADRGHISGEDLACLCSVSRTAIWKAIASLKKQGYIIEGITNRGYKIVAEPDPLDSEIIKKNLEEAGFDYGPVEVYESVDSTNLAGKRKISEIGSFIGPDGKFTEKGALWNKSLFVSGHQTSGRGRMGRVFVSPPNTGVYFSFLYAPESGISDPSFLTATAAVAVSEAIDELYKTKSSGIKWVNDVFVNGRKVCGILTEGSANFETGRVEACVTGIGINLYPVDFGKEAGKVAGALLQELGYKKNPVSRNELVSLIVKKLLAYYTAIEKKDSTVLKPLMQKYRDKSILIGKTVLVNPVAGLSGQEPYQALILDIDDKAQLVVQKSDGTVESLHSGEVSLNSLNFTV